MTRLIGTLTLALGITAGSAAGPVPDFRLKDVNKNSLRADAVVSPRDYRLQVSAFYFGAAG